MANDLTIGKPARVILLFSLPLLLSTAIQQLYNIADSIIIGNLDSTDGLAAIGAAYPITLFYVAIATGSAMGCSVVISQLFGAKKMGELKSAMYTALISFTILGAVLALLGFFLAGPILQLMNCNPDAFENARIYISIYALGAFPMLVFNAISSIFTGVGDAKRPLIFLIISSVLNVILDIIAVGPLKWGVRGAAIATSFSQLVAALLSAFILVRKMCELEAGDDPVVYFSAPLLKRIASMAIPSILQQVCVAIGHCFIQSMVNTFSTSVMAGYEIGSKIVNFIYMCFNTLGTALSSFTGQNLGAGKTYRINSGYRISCIICFAVVAAVVGLVQLFAMPLAGLFMDTSVGDSAKVLEVAVSFIRIVTLDQFIVSQIIPAGGLLRGLGKIKLFFIATVVDFTTRVVMTYVLIHALSSINGAYWAWFFGSTIDLILLLIFIAYEKKKGILSGQGIDQI